MHILLSYENDIDNKTLKCELIGVVEAPLIYTKVK